ncbi:MAG: hypothetical protein AB1502_06720 [Thermodesulfobacteriota bacterium]
MDSYFLYFILFSFVLIALILFIIFFLDELKEIKGHFRLKQYIIYVLGTLFILISVSLSYFLYLHATLWLAISVFIAFNGAATYFLYRASTMIKGRDWEEG